MENIHTQKDYDALMGKIEALIKKASELGGFKNLPKEDVKAFADYSVLAEKYEDEVLKLVPFEGRNPIVSLLEEEMFKRRMKQKEFADFLQISPATLSGVINGKSAISIQLAKQIHKVLGVDGNLILENV